MRRGSRKPSAGRAHSSSRRQAARRSRRSVRLEDVLRADPRVTAQLSPASSPVCSSPMSYLGAPDLHRADRRLLAARLQPAAEAANRRGLRAGHPFRRLPDPCRSRRTRGCAGADAVELARHQSADVGPAGQPLHAALPAGALRPPRPRRSGVPKGPYSMEGSAATRSR